MSTTSFSSNPDQTFNDFNKTVNTSVIAYSVTSLIIVVIIAAVCIYVCKNRKKLSKELAETINVIKQPGAPPLPSHTVVPIWEADAPTMERFFHELAQEKPVRFTPQQLCSFTNNYAKILGSGGYGKVYEGTFPNGVKIAVKVLNKGANAEDIERQQFMAEVGSIGRVHHINLVRLYGFCYDHLMSALVYEFMENKSLDKHLFNEDHRLLEWDKLHEIAVGTAKGLAYLHEECEKRIVHYDIKPENVLLDAKFSPKVADFGLAKLSSRDDTHVSLTGCRGTRGYIAPEFMLRNHPITYKCDVYSFGMMLFEIVGRRRNAAGGGGDSSDWFPEQVWEGYEKGELSGLVGGRGIEEKERSRAERMCMVALWCAQDSPEARPRMSAVVKMLEGGVEIVAPPKSFNYWFSNAVRGVSVSGNGSGLESSKSEERDSCWYKEPNTTTPIMEKYGINVATM